MSCFYSCRRSSKISLCRPDFSPPSSSSGISCQSCESAWASVWPIGKWLFTAIWPYYIDGLICASLNRGSRFSHSIQIQPSLTDTFHYHVTARDELTMPIDNYQILTIRMARHVGMPWSNKVDGLSLPFRRAICRSYIYFVRWALCKYSIRHFLTSIVLCRVATQ